MTLKGFKICTLPRGARLAIVPGGKITPETAKSRRVEIDFCKSDERIF